MRDVKCSANWMWPAKMEGEGSNLFEGCRSMCQVMRGLGVGVDGGKDSLSMVSVVQGRTVKSVPSLVVSCYAPCTDITKVVTPDLKGAPNSSKLVWVQFQGGIPVLGEIFCLKKSYYKQVLIKLKKNFRWFGFCSLLQAAGEKLPRPP